MTPQKIIDADIPSGGGFVGGQRGAASLGIGVLVGDHDGRLKELRQNLGGLIQRLHGKVCGKELILSAFVAGNIAFVNLPAGPLDNLGKAKLPGNTEQRKPQFFGTGQHLRAGAIGGIFEADNQGGGAGPVQFL